MEIAARLPPLKVLLHEVNAALQLWHEKAKGCLPMICRFKAGDSHITYESYPTEISYETLRAALTISGMRQPKRNTL